VANGFLNSKQALVDAEELSPRTWAEYKAVADELIGHFGKLRLVSDVGPDDFTALRNKLAKKWGRTRSGRGGQGSRMDQARRVAGGCEETSVAARRVTATAPPRPQRAVLRFIDTASVYPGESGGSVSDPCGAGQPEPRNEGSPTLDDNGRKVSTGAVLEAACAVRG
jgi:hypothetical protein